MPHVRQNIRAAIGDVLKGLATTGPRVYVSRLYLMRDVDLPGLRIYTNDEEVEYITFAPVPEQQRRLEVIIECCAKANNDLDEVLDTMCSEVEVKIANNQTLGGAKHIVLRSSEIEMASDAEKPYGVARLKFECTYLTLHSVPDTPL